MAKEIEFSHENSRTTIAFEIETLNNIRTQLRTSLEEANK